MTTECPFPGATMQQCRRFVDNNETFMGESLSRRTRIENNRFFSNILDHFVSEIMNRFMSSLNFDQ